MSIGNCIVNGLLLKRSLGFLAVFLLAATAVAERISMYTTNGTDGVSGHVTADNNGYFGGSSINLKNVDELSSYTRKGYIRMDITNKSFVAKTAYLDLVVSLTDSAYSSYPQTVNIYGLTDESLDSWDSSTTTWNNAPGNDSSSPTALDPAKTVFLGSFKVATSDTGKTKRLAGGDLVDFLNDDTNGKVTFILCRPVETWSGYNLVLSGDANSTYAPPKLTISSEITTLTGSDGDAGYVQGDNTGNFGGAYIRTKNSGGNINNYTRKGYIRMDVSSIDFSVSTAYLALTIAVDDPNNYYSKNQTLKVYGLTDQSLDNWDASSTIWNNAPGNDTTSAYKADTNNTVFLGDITVPYTVDPGSVVRLISHELVDFLNSDTNGLVTFIIGRVNDDQGDGGWGNLISAGGYNTTYDPPVLGVSPNISGTVQVGDDNGYFPTSGWHVKNAGIENAVTRKGYVRQSISPDDLPVKSAQLDIMLSLVDDVSDYFGHTQYVKVYGLTDQSLDNWDPSTTTWSTAPANDTSSTYAPDLSKAVFLGDITVAPSDEAGDVKSLSNQNLVSFLNSDTNGLVTFIFGRYSDFNHGGGQNLLFAGELSTVYDAPSLTVFPKGPPEGTVVLIY